MSNTKPKWRVKVLPSAPRLSALPVLPERELRIDPGPPKPGSIAETGSSLNTRSLSLSLVDTATIKLYLPDSDVSFVNDVLGTNFSPPGKMVTEKEDGVETKKFKKVSEIRPHPVSQAVRALFTSCISAYLNTYPSYDIFAGPFFHKLSWRQHSDKMIKDLSFVPGNCSCSLEKCEHLKNFTVATCIDGLYYLQDKDFDALYHSGIKQIIVTYHEFPVVETPFHYCFDEWEVTSTSKTILMRSLDGQITQSMVYQHGPVSTNAVYHVGRGYKVYLKHVASMNLGLGTYNMAILFPISDQCSPVAVPPYHKSCYVPDRLHGDPAEVRCLTRIRYPSHSGDSMAADSSWLGIVVRGTYAGRFVHLLLVKRLVNSLMSLKEIPEVHMINSMFTDHAKRLCLAFYKEGRFDMEAHVAVAKITAMNRLDEARLALSNKRNLMYWLLPNLVASGTKIAFYFRTVRNNGMLVPVLVALIALLIGLSSLVVTTSFGSICAAWLKTFLIFIFRTYWYIFAPIALLLIVSNTTAADWRLWGVVVSEHVLRCFGRFRNCRDTTLVSYYSCSGDIPKLEEANYLKMFHPAFDIGGSLNRWVPLIETTLDFCGFFPIAIILEVLQGNWGSILIHIPFLCWYNTLVAHICWNHMVKEQHRYTYCVLLDGHMMPRFPRCQWSCDSSVNPYSFKTLSMHKLDETTKCHQRLYGRAMRVFCVRERIPHCYSSCTHNVLQAINRRIAYDRDYPVHIQGWSQVVRYYLSLLPTHPVPIPRDEFLARKTRTARARQIKGEISFEKHGAESRSLMHDCFAKVQLQAENPCIKMKPRLIIAVHCEQLGQFGYGIACIERALHGSFCWGKDLSLPEVGNALFPYRGYLYSGDFSALDSSISRPLFLLEGAILAHFGWDAKEINDFLRDELKWMARTVGGDLIFQCENAVRKSGSPQTAVFNNAIIICCHLYVQLTRYAADRQISLDQAIADHHSGKFQYFLLNNGDNWHYSGPYVPRPVDYLPLGLKLTNDPSFAFCKHRLTSRGYLFREPLECLVNFGWSSQQLGFIETMAYVKGMALGYLTLYCHEPVVAVLACHQYKLCCRYSNVEAKFTDDDNFMPYMMRQMYMASLNVVPLKYEVEINNTDREDFADLFDISIEEQLLIEAAIKRLDNPFGYFDLSCLPGLFERYGESNLGYG